MEKLVYVVWKESNESRGDFCGRMLDGVANKLLAVEGVRHLQVNVADADIEPGEATMLQSNTAPRPWAFVFAWLDSAATQAQAVTDVIAAACARTSAYLVTESMPIVNTTQTVALSERTPGFSQVAILQRPPRLSESDWLSVWQGSHTQIAIDTQSTFEYIQNVVARPVTYASPSYHAFVEECFPLAALSDPHAFYDAQGDAKKFEKHLKIMMDSCARFIDFDKIDVILTSQYRFA